MQENKRDWAITEHMTINGADYTVSVTAAPASTRASGTAAAIAIALYTGIAFVIL